MKAIDRGLSPAVGPGSRRVSQSADKTARAPSAVRRRAGDQGRATVSGQGAAVAVEAAQSPGAVCEGKPPGPDGAVAPPHARTVITPSPAGGGLGCRGAYA